MGFLTSLIKSIVGPAAHGDPDVGFPVGVGVKAVELGSDPTEHAAADISSWLATRQGIPFVICGTPHIQTEHQRSTTATTGTLVGSVANERIVIVSISVFADNANGGDQKVTFQWSTDPTTVWQHSGIAPGAGLVIGNGAGIMAVSPINQILQVVTDAAETIDAHCSFFRIAAS